MSTSPERGQLLGYVVIRWSDLTGALTVLGQFPTAIAARDYRATLSKRAQRENAFTVHELWEPAHA